MVFADRVEVWNPGSLPPSLSLAQLRQPHGSIPANPLLAEPLYLTQYIERLGTGTGDMIRRCREAGLREPVFALEDGFRISLGRPLPEPSSSVTTEETKQETEEETKEETKEEARLLLISGDTPGKASLSRQLILAQLRAHPEVTIAELARRLNLSDSGVEYNIRKLRQEGQIRREGSTKAGRWIVLDSPPGRPLLGAPRSNRSPESSPAQRDGHNKLALTYLRQFPSGGPRALQHHCRP
jgi:predicted HTH transcriptional regulator